MMLVSTLSYSSSSVLGNRLCIQFIWQLSRLNTSIYSFSCLILISSKGMSLTSSISISCLVLSCLGDFSRGEQLSLDMSELSSSE